MVTPQPNLNPEAMPWARDKDQRLLKLEADAVRRAQGEVNSNSQQNSTLGQLGQQLVILQGLVDDLTQQVADAIAANSYTAAVIDSKIANPVDVTASGRVYSTGPLVSPGSHDYNVSVGYVAAWINGDGTIGTSPSSGAVKVDLAVFTDDDSKKLLGVKAYWGRYMWDSSESQLKAFVLAEDLQNAGFGPDVAPTVDGDEPRNIGTKDDPVLVEPGKAWTVNYSQLVVPLIALAQSQQKQIDDLTARLDAADL